MIQQEDAEKMLQDVPLVTLTEGAVMTVRALRTACLEADIPVKIGACPKGG